MLKLKLYKMKEFKKGDKVLIMGGPAEEVTITEVFETSVLTTFGGIRISKKSLRTKDGNDWTIK